VGQRARARSARQPSTPSSNGHGAGVPPLCWVGPAGPALALLVPPKKRTNQFGFFWGSSVGSVAAIGSSGSASAGGCETRGSALVGSGSLWAIGTTSLRQR